MTKEKPEDKYYWEILGGKEEASRHDKYDPELCKHGLPIDYTSCPECVGEFVDECEHGDFIENGVCGDCGAIVESEPYEHNSD